MLCAGISRVTQSHHKVRLSLCFSNAFLFDSLEWAACVAPCVLSPWWPVGDFHSFKFVSLWQQITELFCSFLLRKKKPKQKMFPGSRFHWNINLLSGKASENKTTTTSRTTGSDSIAVWTVSTGSPTCVHCGLVTHSSWQFTYMEVFHFTLDNIQISAFKWSELFISCTMNILSFTLNTEAPISSCYHIFFLHLCVIVALQWSTPQVIINL